MSDGFHCKDGLYFKRLDDGSVRIRKRDDARYDAALSTEYVIDKDVWSSIIASVSAGGEGDYRFYAAQRFHDSVGPISIIAAEREEVARPE